MRPSVLHRRLHMHRLRLRLPAHQHHRVYKGLYRVVRIVRHCDELLTAPASCGAVEQFPTTTPMQQVGGHNLAVILPRDVAHGPSKRSPALLLRLRPAVIVGLSLHDAS